MITVVVNAVARLVSAMFATCRLQTHRRHQTLHGQFKFRIIVDAAEGEGEGGRGEGGGGMGRGRGRGWRSSSSVVDACFQCVSSHVHV